MPADNLNYVSAGSRARERFARSGRQERYRQVLGGGFLDTSVSVAK